MIFLLLQGVYFQLFVCKVIRLYNLPLQLTEQNKRTECLRKSITYRPCSRSGKSSLSQGRSSDSFPPLRLPSLKPVAKSARSCPIRAETHSNGYCRRFSRHSLIISGNRITSGKPCDAKLKKYLFYRFKIQWNILPDMWKKDILFKRGLAGIGWCLSYLLRNEQVESDMNSILRATDAVIFRRMVTMIQEPLLRDLSRSVGIGLYAVNRDSRLFQELLRRYVLELCSLRQRI